jgi:hypothetical protein
VAKIIDLFGSFKSEEEKMAFMEAQLATITSLNRQLEQEKLKIKQLEALLKEKAAPVLIGEEKDKEPVPYEEQICKEQLKVLNETSYSRELTAEEARKVEIYSKILVLSKNKDVKKSDAFDKMDTKDLLKLVQNEPPKIS